MVEGLEAASDALLALHKKTEKEKRSRSYRRCRPPGRPLDLPLKTAGASSATNLLSTQIQLFFKVSLIQGFICRKIQEIKKKNNNVETSYFTQLKIC